MRRRTSGSPGIVRPLLLAMLCIATLGCDRGNESAEFAETQSTGESLGVLYDDADALTASNASRHASGKAPRPFKQYTETGDLEAIRDRGRLRILVPTSPAGTSYLPRNGSPLHWQREVAEDFARALGLEPVVISIDSFSKLLPALVEGHGDIIASNLVVTEGRRNVVAFSTPFDRVSEQLVTRVDDASLKSPDDLGGREIVADRSSIFWQTAQSLRSKTPTLNVRHLPLEQAEQLFDRVAAGESDLAIHLSNIIETHLPFRDDLRVAFDVSDSHPVAWAVRKNSNELREALNDYLHREKLTGPLRVFHRDDLPGIKERRTLRILLRNNAASYFLYKGELVGFEYDMLREFAKQQQLRLLVVVPPTHADLLNWLQEGRGDIAGGFLTPEERLDGSIEWTRPYHYAQQMVIGRDDEDIQTEQDLAGRTIVVRRASAYWEPLKRLRERVLFNLQAAPSDMETEEIILAVEQGEYDLTVAGGPVADLDLSAFGKVKTTIPIGGLVPSSWAVRPANTKLKDALDSYVRRQYKSTLYNITYRKYFRGERRIREAIEARVDPSSGQLSPYDDLARQYAERYGLDWRLVVSQMFQESRFDPNTRSWAGAEGLMQVMPRTARSLGFSDVHNPENGIHAGVKYLGWLRDRFDEDLPYSDRVWFMLASYNAGLGHVQDARRLARQLGYDPNRWFGNVEHAMIMLSKPQYYKKARHGYVRGAEPVGYVRKIRDRYEAYMRHTSDRNPAAPPTGAAAGLPSTG